VWRAIRSADVSYHYPNSCKVTFSPAAHAIDFGQEAGMPARLSVIAAAGGRGRARGEKGLRHRVLQLGAEARPCSGAGEAGHLQVRRVRKGCETMIA